MTDVTGPVFTQLNIVVTDMTAALDFYRRLGLAPTVTPDGAHAAASLRRAVDDMYAELTSAGYRGHQRPYDALWGSMYAIVDDPDGNGIGFMSPIEADRRYWPPAPAPREAS